MSLNPDTSYVNTPYGAVAEEDVPVIQREHEYSMIWRMSIVAIIFLIVMLYIYTNTFVSGYTPKTDRQKIIYGSHIVVSFDDRGAIADQITVESPIQKSFIMQRPKLIDRRFEIFIEQDIPIHKVFILQKKAASSSGTLEIFDKLGNRTAIKKIKNSLFQSVVFI